MRLQRSRAEPPSTISMVVPPPARLALMVSSTIRARPRGLPPNLTAKYCSPSILLMPVADNTPWSNTFKANGVTCPLKMESATSPHDFELLNAANTVFSLAGLGVSLNDTSHTTPRLPKPPTCNRAISYPLTFFTTCPPLFVIEPSACTTFIPSTRSRGFPYCHFRGPLVPDARMPPIVALFDNAESIARN